MFLSELYYEFQLFEYDLRRLGSKRERGLSEYCGDVVVIQNVTSVGEFV